MKNEILMRWNAGRRTWQAHRGDHLLFESQDAGEVENYLNSAALSWTTVTPGTRKKPLTMHLPQECRIR